MYPPATQVNQLKYKRDEAVYMLSRVNQSSSYYNGYMDPSGFRAVQFLDRTLLSGSHQKNRNSSLHRSFFRSGLIEPLLVPPVVKYLEQVRPLNETELMDPNGFQAAKCLLRILLSGFPHEEPRVRTPPFLFPFANERSPPASYCGSVLEAWRRHQNVS